AKAARPAAKSAQPAALKATARVTPVGPGQVVSNAPGRINLIGEHTDYNGGLVLPMAIDRYTRARITERPDRHIQVHATDLNKMFTWIEGAFPLEAPSFARYVHGAYIMLGEQFPKIKLPGYAVDITSTVPIGAGLSSSAALSVALLQGMAQASRLPLKRDQIPALAQAIEHRFIGTKCGIMDMFVSVHAKKDHALFLDCKTLKAKPVKISAKKVAVICADSGIRHELADGGYNRIRQECEAAAEKLLGKPGLLRALPAKLLPLLKASQQKGPLAKLTDSEFMRVRHVMTENERVQKTVRLMGLNKWAEVGQLFYGSHKSMRNDFRITCLEVDHLVEKAAMIDGVYGARMTGGGFGGCVVVLAEPKAAERAAEELAEDYKKTFGIILKTYRFQAAGGAFLEK
ncbi:MAG: galactokinase, partial [Planctomycetota bacterium]